jgi:phosphoribosylformimino-5-aminoimidazole carboxamide ribotide isomerase
MEIIPVIDLMGGVVVRARHGERAAYRPIETPLSLSSDPLAVVAGLLSVYPLRSLYIADLDAIEGRGSPSRTIESIARKFPGLSLWIDNGNSDTEAAADFLAAHPRAVLVLGSESQRNCETVRALHPNPRVILSLDFRGEAFLGPPDLLDEPSIWPARIIVMSLARVGGDAGPDFERLRHIGECAGPRSIYLAGGVREARDLAIAEESGAAGVLVASALHDGRLSAADLASIAAPENRKAPDSPEPSRT